MGESLYAILGVERSADQETITEAYREQAKRHHPDVSDDPNAAQHFRRLTVARETLLDDDERARYDAMGHRAYAHQHDDADLFDVTTRTPTDSIDVASTTDQQRADGAGADVWWRQRPGPEPKTSMADGERTQHEQRRRRGTAAAWTQSRASSNRSTSARTGRSLRRFRAVIPWLVLHLFLFCSALATALFVYTSVGARLAIPSVVFGVVLILTVVVVSTFHLVSVLYS